LTINWSNGLMKNLKKRYLITLMLCAGSALAQSVSDDGIRADNVVMPEAYKCQFNSAGSVDFHGAYTANLPLMTVPGRGGLDYPIGINYKSGITTTQRSTWVGLGWNLNPGSIVRIINGIPDNGDREDYAPLLYSGMTYVDPYEDYCDSYLVNIPGVISGVIVQTGGASGNMGNTNYNFRFENWNGWRIFTNMRTFNRVDNSARTYPDFGEFVLTDEHGTTYKFGLPLRSEMIIYGGSHNDAGVRYIEEYVSSWQLTAIHSENCPINVTPTESSPGNWVKFVYGYNANGAEGRLGNPAADTNRLRDLRPLYHDRLNTTTNVDPYGLLQQSTYLERIITPTHEAVFLTSGKNDISYKAPIYTDGSHPHLAGELGDFTYTTSGSTIQPLRLNAILLYQRVPSHALISFVTFDYAAQGQELCPYGNVGPFTNLSTTGKSTLTKVTIADSSQGSFYRFGYTSDIDNFNPDYYKVIYPDITGSHSIGNYWRTHTGRMGYFYDLDDLYGSVTTSTLTKGAAAWSLRTIEYPTGVIDTIAYELNTFNKTYDSTNSAVNSTLSRYSSYHFWDNFAPDEAGIRVKYISTYDPVSQEARKVVYQYPTYGILPGLPGNYLRNKDTYVGSQNYRMFMSGVGSSEVEYPCVTTVNADGSKSTVYYTAANDVKDTDGNFYDSQTDGSRIVSGHTSNYIFMAECSWYRGKVKAAIDSNASGQNTKASYSVYATGMGLNLSDGTPTSGSKIPGGSYWVYKTSDTSYVYEPNGTNRLKTLTLYSYEQHGFTQSIQVQTPGLIAETDYFYRINEMSDSVTADLIAHNLLTPLKYKMAANVTTEVITYGGNAQIQSAQIHSSEQKSLILPSLQIGTTVVNQIKTLQSMTKYSWKKFNSGDYMDSILTWNDLNGNQQADDNEFFPVKIATSFDNYGNPLIIKDGNTVPINLEWGSTYNYSKLTKRTVNAGGMPLVKQFSYNLLHLLSSQTDENLSTTSYFYDGLGRLKKIIGPDGKTLRTFQYNFKNTIPTTTIPGGQN
jgi:YD repeat-containing protein